MPKRLVRLALLAACSVVATAVEAQSHGSLTIDNVSDIKYPTSQQWSPDSNSIAFLWDAAGKQDLYLVSPGGKPVALTDFPVNSATQQSDLGHFEWASDNKIIIVRNNGLWLVSTKGDTPHPLPGFDGVSSFSLSSDKQQISFVHQGQVWIANLKAQTRRQITKLPRGLNPNSPGFSPDSRYVAFSAARTEDDSLPLPFNGERLRVYQTFAYDTQLGIVSVFGGDPVMFPTSGGGGRGGATHQWVLGDSLLHQEISADRRTREIRITAPDGVTRVLWKDFDPKWWAPTDGPATVASPNGKWVAFVDDRSGWPHVYVISSDATSESAARDFSKGDLAAGYITWSPDNTSIAFAQSEPGNQMERFLSVADVAKGTVKSVVKQHGVNISPVFSPDGSMLAYERAATEHPLEVYFVPLSGGEPTRLTDSLPPSIRPTDLTAPVPVRYPSRAEDHQQVPATIIVHKDLDKNKRHPAIIWIHGSGADQNYLGWHPGAYRMYYAIHQYLAQQGYVILTPDYRGSSGYSRSWTQGHYMDLGGAENEDVAGGADYLKSLPYVDPDRIGVWGLSYGGFMTLQAVTTTPQLFRCAIDVAGVGDWATHTAWSIGRMGTSVSNPDGHERSAPVKHLDKLERPLLILQGTNDVNVPFIQTLAVVDQLEKLGKPFELALYPGEIHFFRRAFVLRDAWRRSEAFFDKYLRDPDITEKAFGNEMH